jgi:hypothetical protein
VDGQMVKTKADEISLKMGFAFEYSIGLTAAV